MQNTVLFLLLIPSFAVTPKALAQPFVDERQCSDIFSTQSMTPLNYNIAEHVYTSMDGKWFLSSTIKGLSQEWTLINLLNAEQVQFTTEAPSDAHLLNTKLKQIVSFETDHIKIYTYLENQFKSLYQINHQGEQIGSANIKRASQGAVIADSFFISEKLRFYKHNETLQVQTYAGVFLRNIPAPDRLSDSSLVVQGSHLVVVESTHLTIYKIHENELETVRTVEIENALSSAAKNPEFKKIIDSNSWQFGETLSISEHGSLLFQLKSQRLRHTIAMASMSDSQDLQILGHSNPRFIMKNFSFMNTEGDFFTFEQAIQKRAFRTQYTSVLRFYDKNNNLKSSIDLANHWTFLWNSSSTVVLANDGLGLLQSWDLNGTLISVYKAPKSRSHPMQEISKISWLGNNSWLANDTRTDHQYRIFDGNLRIRTVLNGKLFTSDQHFGLLAISPTHNFNSRSTSIFRGLSIYNKEGQLVANFPELPHYLQGVRFLSENSLLAYDKVNYGWFLVQWD